MNNRSLILKRGFERSSQAVQFCDLSKLHSARRGRPVAKLRTIVAKS